MATIEDFNKLDIENSGNYVAFSPEFSNGQSSRTKFLNAPRIKSRILDVLKTSNTINRIVHIRVGIVKEVDDFSEAKKRAYKLTIDFGEEIGIKRSSVQIVNNYKKDELFGKQVLGVVNLPAKNIGPFTSEVLILGVPDDKDNCVLITPTKQTKIGGKLY